ncbi:hypothetical protein F5Y19DRAFT_141251 [Xylariaceae sp. FL1651]|nr:hypothetical protein F5Y19DRAFT_141251 [Xylariaceae sp. FL1651]
MGIPHSTPRPFKILFSPRGHYRRSGPHEKDEIPYRDNFQGGCEPQCDKTPALFRLTDLPLEMVVEISGHLSSADSVALALTCRDLYLLLKANLAQLSIDARLTLLTRLERDIPGVVYCPYVNKLRTISLDRERYTRVPYRHNPQEAGFIPGGYYLYCSWPRLSPLPKVLYLDTRLVRNHQLLGPAHGIAASCLHSGPHFFTKKKVFEQFTYTMVVEISHVARWIDESLFLSSTRTINLSEFDTDQKDCVVKLRNLLHGADVDYVCRHCNISGGRYGTLVPHFNGKYRKIRLSYQISNLFVLNHEPPIW